MVIVDEAQSVASSKLLSVLQATTARYVYGMTATPKRSDGLDRIIFLECGPLLYEIDVKAQVAEQGMRRVLVPRFTSAQLSESAFSSWQGIMEALSNDHERNDFICRDVARAIACGRSPLVLTRRVEHARHLGKMLQEMPSLKNVKVVVLVGQDAEHERRRKLANLRNFPDELSLCIVATGSYVGVGFDFDRLDALFLAGPVSFEGMLAQWTGRLHRTREGKADVVVIDYVDAAIPMLEREWRRRLKTYKKLRYSVAESEDLSLVGIEERNGMHGFLHGGKSFLHMLEQDVLTCSKSIFISSSWLHPRRVRTLLPLLEKTAARDVEVCVRVRRPKNSTSNWSDAVSELEKTCTQVCFDDAEVLDYVVIDRTIAWYGGIAPLGFARKDDYSIRFVHPQLAHELIEVGTLTLAGGR